MKIETFKWKVLQLTAVVSDARQNLVTKQSNPAEITDINQTFIYYAAKNATFKRYHVTPESTLLHSDKGML